MIKLQLQNWVGGAPNLYDISGSAHFINKCDNGIVIHRNRDPEAGPMDQVQVCGQLLFIINNICVLTYICYMLYCRFVYVR